MRHLLLTGTVFCACLALGMPLPVTPVAIQHKLGFGGAAAVLASVLPLLAAAWDASRARQAIERRGARRTAIHGALLGSLGALLCLAATWPGSGPAASFALLAAGRLASGVGASRCIAGVFSWSIAKTAHVRLAAAVLHIGNVAFVALAAGVAAGLALHDRLGFRAAMLGCSAAALLALGMVLGAPACPPRREQPGAAWRRSAPPPRLMMSRRAWLAAGASGCFLYLMADDGSPTARMMLAYGIVLLPWAFLSIAVHIPLALADKAIDTFTYQKVG